MPAALVVILLTAICIQSDSTKSHGITLMSSNQRGFAYLHLTTNMIRV